MNPSLKKSRMTLSFYSSFASGSFPGCGFKIFSADLSELAAQLIRLDSQLDGRQRFVAFVSEGALSLQMNCFGQKE